MIAPTTPAVTTPITTSVTTPEAEQLVSLTPRGAATLAVYRLARAVADLAPEDRAAIHTLLAQVLPIV